MLFALALLVPAAAQAQFPDGPGKAEMMKLCSTCHEVQRSASMRMDRDGWKNEVDKMVSLGMKGSDQEIAAIVDYLARTFPAEAIERLNVNKATQIEFESRLSLKRSEARAVIEYRDKNGPFKSLADLKKVPGIDVAKIESKKDVITF
jgi:competence ComEA-like helix-hairpin-helix protein